MTLAGAAEGSSEEDDSRQSDFWTVRPDGSRLQQLTHFAEGTLVLSASYSPNGAWIAHATTGVNGNADLFAMRADGNGNQPIARSKLWDSAPDWGPPRPNRQRDRNDEHRMRRRGPSECVACRCGASITLER